MATSAETGGRSSVSFLIHGVIAIAALVTLNWLIAYYVPPAVEGIGSSYLIFFYHLPAALNCFFFFTAVMVFSIAYLARRDPRWDLRARVAGEVGLVACTITLATGSTWASAAWNTWWVWDDPRLMTAAIMWLTYAAYVLLQTQMDPGEPRRRYAAVFGILAWIDIPLVMYAINVFGAKSHPMQVTMGPEIRWTRWFGVGAFLLLYSLIYRWKRDRDETRELFEESLTEVRRIEEGSIA